MKVIFNNCIGCRNGEISFSPKDSLDDVFALCREKWGDGQMFNSNGEYLWQKSTDRHGPFVMCDKCKCCANPCKCGVTRSKDDSHE